jgi:hypothetical protein
LAWFHQLERATPFSIPTHINVIFAHFVGTCFPSQKCLP